MSNREKLLGFATAGLLGLFAIYGIYSMVTSRIDAKDGEILSLQQRLSKEKLEQEKGRRARNLLYEFRKRSLAAEPDDAHREFVHWLENQVKTAGLQKESVRFQGVPATKKPYKELTYNVSGVGDITQLTSLLYHIHAADTLHRVRNLNVRRQKDTNQLKIDFVVDALSMGDFDPDELQKQRGGKLTPEQLAELVKKTPVGTMAEDKLSMSLEDYKGSINTRNSFSEANLPPKLTTETEQEVELGQRLSLSLKAEDPEKDDVIYELDANAPESARLTESGRLTWRPEEEGEFEFKVYLTDSGIPAKESTATILVKVTPEKVEEEPPREDPFDAAKLAVMTAIVQGPKSPKPQMCMYLRSEDEYQYLAAGDDIEIGKWSGVVVSVDPDSSIARIKTDDGVYVLALGQALADAEFVKADDEGA